MLCKQHLTKMTCTFCRGVFFLVSQNTISNKYINLTFLDLLLNRWLGVAFLFVLAVIREILGLNSFVDPTITGVWYVQEKFFVLGYPKIREMTKNSFNLGTLFINIYICKFWVIKEAIHLNQCFIW